MKYREHHAYLLIGPAERVVPELNAELVEAEIIFQQLPQFGIEESRDLRQKQARRVEEGRSRAFILEFSSITVEAQQALLKTLEEPAERTYFFLVAPTIQMFLPTLLSRLRVEISAAEDSVSDDSQGEADLFLAAGPEERLAQVAKFLEGEEAPAALRARALLFVNALELRLHREFKDAWDTRKVQALGSLEQVRDYLHDRASSPRLLLEHLALLLPRL